MSSPPPPPQDDSPPVTFRSHSRPTSMFSRVSALPAALAALNPAAASSTPSELTALAEKMRNVRLTSPAAAASVKAKLDYGKDDDDAGTHGDENRPELCVASKSPAAFKPSPRRPALAVVQDGRSARASPPVPASALCAPPAPRLDACAEDGRAEERTVLPPAGLPAGQSSPEPSPVRSLPLSPFVSPVSASHWNSGDGPSVPSKASAETAAPRQPLQSPTALLALENDSDSDGDDDHSTFHDALSEATPPRELQQPGVPEVTADAMVAQRPADQAEDGAVSLVTERAAGEQSAVAADEPRPLCEGAAEQDGRAKPRPVSPTAGELEVGAGAGPQVPAASEALADAGSDGQRGDPTTREDTSDRQSDSAEGADSTTEPDPAPHAPAAPDLPSTRAAPASPPAPGSPPTSPGLPASARPSKTSAPSPSAAIRTSPLQPAADATAPRAGNVGSSAAADHSEAVAMLAKHVDVISDVHTSSTWRDRVAAMDALSDALCLDRGASGEAHGSAKEVLQFFAAHRSRLTRSLAQHSTEIRPSIVASSYGLFDKLLRRRVLECSDLDMGMFQRGLEAASGGSKASASAAKCVTTMLASFPDLFVSHLSLARNADKMRAACAKVSDCPAYDDDCSSRATNFAIRLVDGLFEDKGLDDTDHSPPTPGDQPGATGKESDGPTPTEVTPVKLAGGARMVSHAAEPDQASSGPLVPAGTNSNPTPLAALDSPPPPGRPRPHERVSVPDVGAGTAPPARPESRTVPGTDQLGKGAPSTPSSRKVGEEGAAAARPCSSPAGGARSFPPMSLPPASPRTVRGEGRLSGNKMTPVSLRKRRLYTEEELDEARRVALRHAMEEANSLFAEERGKAEVRVSKAEGEKRALQDALNQFEATIGEMVARDNSNVSATVAALESDRSGLKAELLEVTEAFDKLKARYDELKDSVSESEGRAQRLATQNDDLKTGMLDLTNWSNELKANTEKKLAASFESASRFRTMFLDKEAREAKVAEELKVAQLELGSREEALTTALAKVSRLEAEHGKADDGRRSSERALAQARQRIAAAEHEQSDTQAQLSALKKELEVAEELAAKCSAARAAARAAEERLDAFGKENKDLKARAYDDLTKVKALEAKLGAKASELDEMALMCEELMAREEARSERAAS